MNETKTSPEVSSVQVTTIGTSPSGSVALLALVGAAWVAWIGFLVWILLTQT